MRVIHSMAFGALMCACIHAQDATPPQLQALRARYEAAVKVAVEPTRLRYLDELQRMRDAAMSQKKLDVANVINGDIAAVTAQAAEAGPKTAGPADENVPATLKSARTRYQAAIKVATEPVQRSYVGELKTMMSGALAQKNLDLANAIDAELKALASGSDAGTGRLAGELADTTWSWGVTIASATSTLRFLKDGTCTVNNISEGKWHVLNSNTVKIESGAVLKFSKDMKTYEGTSGKGAPRAGKRL